MKKTTFFGEILRTLLNAAGIKRSQLANCLGYDISYVSRWINGQKLPSLKNDYRLFEKIAALISREGGEEGKENITRAFEMDPRVPSIAYEKWIVGQLTDAYNNDKKARGNLTAKSSTEDSSHNITSISSSYDKNQKYIMDTIANLTSQRITNLTFFTMPSDEDFRYHECGSYWNGILSLLPNTCRSRVQLAIDFTSRDVLLSVCRDLCVFYAMDPSRVSVELYSRSMSDDSCYSLWICENVIASIAYRDAFLESTQSILTNDPLILSTYENRIHTFLRGRESLIQTGSLAALFLDRNLADLIPVSNTSELYAIMPSVFLPEKLYDSVNSKNNNIYHMFLKTRRNALIDASSRFLIYKSALVRFFMNHQIILGEDVFVLTAEESLSLLQSLRSFLDSDPQRLRILNDNNPLLDSADFGSSLMINSNGIIFARRRDDNTFTHDPICFSSNEGIITAFKRFYTALWSQSPPNILPKQNAFALLDSGINILMSN